jgi:hypothetical protein
LDFSFHFQSYGWPRRPGAAGGGCVFPAAEQLRTVKSESQVAKFNIFINLASASQTAKEMRAGSD